MGNLSVRVLTTTGRAVRESVIQITVFFLQK